MKTIWVKCDPWDQDLVTTAIEGGADALLVEPEMTPKVKALGRVTTIAEDGDLVLGKDVVSLRVKGQEDEAEILRAARDRKVILDCPDWTVIPLENLIARGAAGVVAKVSSLAEAKTAFCILEKGVDHILLDIPDPLTLKSALSELRFKDGRIPLEIAEVTEVLSVGMGDRVCVDTCTAMTPGQGMLVGNSSSALFLIHAETLVNPYVAPRPFRVNAGAVHAYTRVPGGRTRYLSELAAGDPVLLVDHAGNVTEGIVGRIKIEKRPLMLIRAVVGDTQIATIVQNAETIRLTGPDGDAVSVVALSPGDRILVATESGGRHFGHAIAECIMEK